MSEQDELSDSKIKQMWIDAWLEQDTGVEPDDEEVKALKSFLAKAKQHYEQKMRELFKEIEKLMGGMSASSYGLVQPQFQRHEYKSLKNKYLRGEK